MLPRIVERHLGPTFLRQRQIHPRVGQIHKVAIDILRQLQRIGLGELGQMRGVGAGHPAGGVDAGVFEAGVDAVFGTQAMRDDFELQLADGAN